MSIKDRIILLKEPNSPVAESYRSLRAALSRNLVKGKRRFTIVSSWGGEGKSMVSANLAVGFSQLLIEVVLVDGDLRRPTLSRVFEQQNNKGLKELLAGEAGVADCLYSTPIERLSFLPAGLSNDNPADLLGTGRLKRILEEECLKDRCLVIDTSPLSACADALMIAAQTDGAIMVVSPEAWRGDAEAHYAADLEDHGIEVFGVVLNNADPSEQVPGSGYGDNYGYGYGYGYGQTAGYGQEYRAPETTKSGFFKLFPKKRGNKGHLD